ncbi:MAG TPA: ATP-binding protein [Anaerolineae bacterium]|nr:ATP-binding protein [Anaerolineae bacterium]
MDVDSRAFYLLKSVNKANREHSMFEDGDAILVAVSGGKDSLTMLDLLHRRQRVAREHYTIVAGKVRTDFHSGPAVPGNWLHDWCDAHKIRLVVEEIPIALELAHMRRSKCFRCAWQRRKALFQMADRLGCNKVALGHNADDIAETMLMSLFYSARFQRMEPRASFFRGRLVVIRPLAYIEERDIVPFARASGFPIQGEPCPEGLRSRRAAIKRMLREIETEGHDVKRHIFRAFDRNHARHLRAARGIVRQEG